eukprot:TRINITY_DN8971_c0_g1_i2.p3 TRINITY_DN8971_c0_g1~~TRINITY_DN8971_c0_g1_i2.p3  ORF type:complete len:175 (+),score=7.42 TRINITY_DN8971_c0_g1_i2:95-619(+)
MTGGRTGSGGRSSRTVAPVRNPAPPAAGGAGRAPADAQWEAALAQRQPPSRSNSPQRCAAAGHRPRQLPPGYAIGAVAVKDTRAARGPPLLKRTVHPRAGRGSSPLQRGRSRCGRVLTAPRECTDLGSARRGSGPAPPTAPPGGLRRRRPTRSRQPLLPKAPPQPVRGLPGGDG